MGAVKIPSSFLTSVRTFARKVHEPIVFGTSSGHKKPQIEHIQEVADLVWISGGTDAEIAAAWLHDSVEDTETKLEDISRLFGSDVAELVHGLTDLPEMTDLPTDQRKLAQSRRVRSKGPGVRRIKLADQISNVRYVVTDPPSNWTHENNRMYCAGAKLIADECKGISPLLDSLFEQEYRKAVAHFEL